MAPELIASILAGIALAAAVGLRAFLPLLLVSLGGRFGWVDLNPDMAFLSGDIALIALVIATILEIGADKIPIVDHFLDVSATFVRPAAGAVAGMAMFADLPQPVAIGLALVLGTISLGTHAGRAQLRVGSTVTTGGTANPVVSAVEDGVSGGISLLAILVPILAGIVALLFLLLLFLTLRKLRRLVRNSRKSSIN